MTNRPDETTDGLVRVQVYMPPDLCQRIHDAAGAKRVSKFMREAAEQKLSDQQESVA